MSAAGRSDVREENDVYITCDWSIRRFLEAYNLPQGATVLDPCAANGELLTEIKKLRPDLQLFAIELRPEAGEALAKLRDADVIVGYNIGDFMEIAAEEAATPPGFDYVVTNPPYALAEEMIRASMKIAKISAFLLRINFLGAKDRRDFSDVTKPGLFISPNRPSFTGWGGDATEYAWFIYGDPEWAGKWCMLALCSDEEISDWNARARKRYPHLKPSLVKARKKAAAELEAARKLAASGAPMVNCSVCGAMQIDTPSGVSCPNGHGGAPGVPPSVLSAREVMAIAALSRP